MFEPVPWKFLNLTFVYNTGDGKEKACLTLYTALIRKAIEFSVTRKIVIIEKKIRFEFRWMKQSFYQLKRNLGLIGSLKVVISNWENFSLFFSDNSIIKNRSIKMPVCTWLDLISFPSRVQLFPYKSVIWIKSKESHSN